MTSAPLAGREFERILLVKPSSLGDVIHALPVLHVLRKRFPSAQIDWVIGSAFAPLLRDHPDITRLVEFDRKRYGKMWKRPGAGKDFAAWIAALRSERYDCVIDLQGLFRSGFITRATGAPIRIGFADAREGARWCYTHSLPGASAAPHAVDRNLQVASLLGIEADRARFPLPISTDAAEEVRGLLENDGPDHINIITLVPGARWDTKRWPPERFGQLADRLAASTGHRIALLGGPGELGTCEAVANAASVPVTNLAGKTSLPDLVAVIAQSSLVVCHDSAAAHLAVALERPLVCITGPTDPARTGPYDRPGAVARLDLECAPCFFRSLTQCPHEHRCMTELTVDQVARQAQTELARAEHVAEATGQSSADQEFQA